jgi:anti-sigma factor RsiW
MAGDEWQAKLDTYLDGELPSDQVRALDAHLRTCPSCTADVLNRVQIKRAVQTAGKRYAPSAEFRQRMQKSLGAGRSRAAFPWRWAIAGVMAVILVAGALFVSREQQRLRRDHIYSELADLHVSTLASSAPVDVVSTDRHTVKPWFQGKIPFTFNLPELKDSDFVLVGGRVAYLGQAPGAQLIYQVRKHEISVFMFQERALRENLRESTPVMRRLSFNMESWSQGGLRYFVVGDAAAEDIRKLSQLLKTAT